RGVDPALAAVREKHAVAPAGEEAGHGKGLRRAELGAGRDARDLAAAADEHLAARADTRDQGPRRLPANAAYARFRRGLRRGLRFDGADGRRGRRRGAFGAHRAAERYDEEEKDD